MRLLLCRCLQRTMKQTVKVQVPRLSFDTFLKSHFRENDLMLAHDEHEICQPNDWLLIRELPERLSIKVRHQVVKVVYTSGDIRDPVTQLKSLGSEYEEDVYKLSQAITLKMESVSK